LGKGLIGEEFFYFTRLIISSPMLRQ